MSIVEIDGLGESDGEVFKNIVPGIYNGTIISSVLRVNENEGDWQGSQVLDLAIKVEGDIAKTIRHSIFLPFPAQMDAEGIRKSIARLKALRMACGTDDNSNTFDPEEFMHQTVRVVVGMDKNKNDNNIRDIQPA